MAGLALLAATGCSSSSGTPDNDPADAAEQSSSAAPESPAESPSGSPAEQQKPGKATSKAPRTSGAETIEYVALGDSYTAAPFVPGDGSKDPSGCLRSPGNYPSLVAAADDRIALTDVSCAGAATLQLTGPQTVASGQVPPQLDALSDRTDLVTLGMGGNDYSVFARMAATCVTGGSDACRGEPKPNDPELGTIDKIEQNLVDSVAAIAERAPNARILLVNYPRLLPDDGTCDAIPLRRGGYDYILGINEALSEAVDDAVAASDGAAELVDVWSASRGHDICSAKPWVNGLQDAPGRAMSLHPFAAEQKAVARLISATL